MKLIGDIWASAVIAVRAQLPRNVIEQAANELGVSPIRINGAAHFDRESEPAIVARAREIVGRAAEQPA